MIIINQYPDFEFHSDELSKFIATADMVTIMLKNGSIIHHFPKDLPKFLNWLKENDITNLKEANLSSTQR